MKPVTICLIIALGLIACRKDLQPSMAPWLRQLQLELKDSLPQQDYAALDFTRAVLSKVDTAELYFLRVPQKGKRLESAFLLVQTTVEGRLIRGRQVTLERHQSTDRLAFNGSIRIRSLGGDLLLQAPVVAGAIQWRAAGSRLSRIASLQPDPYTMLPEVIVVGTRTTIQDHIYSDWINLQGLFGDYEMNDPSYYGSLDGTGGGGGGSGTSGSNYEEENMVSGGSVYVEQMIQVDYEFGFYNPAIDVQQFIKCFEAIPDAGSSCSIEIFADVPVDTDPNKIFEISSGSPGHAFIQIKKSNGSQGAIQNIGFYPKSGWKPAATNAPVEGKFVDNGEHEYNASFKMDLSPQNFRSVLAEIIYLANFVNYDIDNYNCTDFALDVFNKTRRERFDIPLIHIPGNYPSTGTRTPQGIYSKLKQMKDSGHPESANITINILKGWVAKSTGPCN